MSTADAHVPIDRLLAHRPWVRMLARALVADPATADDLEQETWLAALTNPPRHDRSLRGWLAGVLRNQLALRYRGQARRTRRERAVARDEARPDTADLVAEAEIHGRLVRAVVALDEPERSTILLRFFEGLRPREIAARMGVPVETVRSRVRRAIDKLRERLDGEHGGDRRAWCLALLPLTTGDADVPTGGSGIARRPHSMSWSLGTAAAVVLVAVAVVAYVASPAGPDVGVGGGLDAETAAAVPAPKATEPSADASPGRIDDTSPDPATDVSSPSASESSADPGVVRVLDEQGSPLAGATVTLTARNATDGERAWRGTSDSLGLVRLPRDARARGFLVAQAVGFARYSKTDVRLGATATDVRLARGYALEGTVVDAETGAPLEGAQVVVQDWWVRQRALRDRDALAAAAAYEVVTTGADGRFRAESVPIGDRLLLTITRDGFATVHEEAAVASLSAAATVAPIRLHRGGRLTGTVVRPGGAGLAGAEVIVVPEGLLTWPEGTDVETRIVAFLWGNSSLVVGGPEHALHATTRADGGFEIAGVPLDTPLAVVAIADELGRSEPWRVPPLAGEAAGSSGTLTLRPRGSLHVTVLAPDGTPAPHPDCVVAWQHSDWDRKDVGDGEVLLGKLEPGPQRFAVGADGYPTELVDLRIEPGTATRHVVRVQTPVGVTGVVVDDDGAPIAGAEITIDWYDPSYRIPDGGSTSRGDATTGADGKFAVTGLRPGPHSVWVKAKGHVELWWKSVEVPIADWRIVDAGEGVVRARVELPPGMSPPATVTVARRPVPARPPANPNAPGWVSWWWTTVPWNDGVVEVRDVCGAEWTVRVFVPGCRAVEVPIQFDASRVADLGTLSPLPAPEFAGRVVDEDGAPVADARVTLTHTDIRSENGELSYMTTSTDASGSFRGALPLAGPITVAVVSPRHVPVRLPWTPTEGGAPLDVRLVRGGLLRGRALLAGGAPAARVTLLVTNMAPAEPTLQTVTDSDGRFEIRIQPGLVGVYTDDRPPRPLGQTTVPQLGEASIEVTLPAPR